MRKKKKDGADRHLTNVFYLNLKNKVITNHDKVFNPINCILQESICDQDLFKINHKIDESFNDSNILNYSLKPEDHSKKIFKCLKINLKLNILQKKIFESWRKAYILMYNETIHFLKKNHDKKKEELYKIYEIQKFFVDYKLFKEYFLNVLHKEKDIKGCKDKDLKKKLKNELLELQNKKSESEKKIKEFYEFIKLYMNEKNHEIIFKFIDNTFKINYQNIRTTYLKDIKNKILEGSKLKDDIFDSYNLMLSENQRLTENRSFIYPHTLDNAIKYACSNYQSGITNLENGNIKKFRIRYWKFNKEFQLFDVETIEFKKAKYENTQIPVLSKLKDNNQNIVNEYFEMARPKIGKIRYFYNNKEVLLDNIKSDCKVYYDYYLQSYKLLIPEELINQKELKEELKPVISLDPGLRTFITGLSKNEILDIFETKDSKLEKYIKKIMDYENHKEKGKGSFRSKENNKKIYRRRKIKMKTLRRKMLNFVTELHWKTANYLTNNYKNILLGDMSSKGIVSNKKSNLQCVSKKMAYALSFHKFRQRLSHKCQQRGNLLYNVNERFTSKTCSYCGEYNKELGSSKVFKCPCCKKELDRDVNSCRNILIKSIN